MTSEVTVPEAAIEAAAIALWNREGGGPDPVPDYIRHDAYATLAAALPHLSTAIRDAALEEAAQAASHAIDHANCTADDMVAAIRALKSIPAPAEGNEAEAAAKPDWAALKATADAAYAAMSPVEQEAMWQAQRESFARSMEPCEHGVADFEDCPDCQAKARSAPAQAPGGLVERLALAEMILAHAEDPALAPVVAALSAAIAALTAADARVAEVERERDEAREGLHFWEDRENEALHRVEAAEASLASARADGVREGLEQGWQSIDTAPRDGTKILAWWSGAPAITYWAKRTGFEGWQLPSMMTIRVADESARAPMFWQPITIPAAIAALTAASHAPNRGVVSSDHLDLAALKDQINDD